MNGQLVAVGVLLGERVIQRWAVELKAQQIARLDQPENWQVLSFLVHHSYLELLADVVAQPPLGKLWEQCAYLEHLLVYIDRCASGTFGRPAADYPPSQLWAALEHVVPSAERLLRVARAQWSIDRANRIIEGARKRLAACEEGPGRRVCLWQWHPLTATATLHPISD